MILFGAVCPPAGFYVPPPLFTHFRRPDLLIYGLSLLFPFLIPLYYLPLLLPSLAFFAPLLFLLSNAAFSLHVPLLDPSLPSLAPLCFFSFLMLFFTFLLICTSFPASLVFLSLFILLTFLFVHFRHLFPIFSFPHLSLFSLSPFFQFCSSKLL